MGQYLFLLLVIACPLMMIFMMRGHGHGGHETASIEELRRRRDELDRQITEREWRGETNGDRRAERV